MRNIDRTHCQSCGSTKPQDVSIEARRANDGYTACCNERAVSPAFNRPTRCGSSTGCTHE